MKKKLAFIFIVCIIFCFIALRAEAEESSLTQYVLREGEGEYTLSVYENGYERDVLTTDRFSAVLEYAASSSCATITALNVTVREDVAFFAQDLTLSGELTVARGATYSVLGGKLTLDGLVLDIYGSALSIKGGEVVMLGGQVSSYDSPAILMDYGALAKFDLRGGTVTAYGGDTAVRIKHGSAFIRGGRIDSDGECAINSDANLTLSGTPKIAGGEIDVITTRPITLAHDDISFFGGVTVKYGEEFQRGKITPVFYRATEDAIRHIRLYDSLDAQMPLKFFESHSSVATTHFAAVYLPFTVDFHGTGGVIYRREILHGGCVTPENPPEREGYEFIGWHTPGGNEPYDFDTEITSDLSLYASYKLTAPTFVLSSLDFYFDGDEHKLQLDALDHPLIIDAALSYTWLRDGEELACNTSALPVRLVADSGDYQCKITLTIGADSVTVFSDVVSVRIRRAVISVPPPESAVYNGEYRSPNVPISPKYDISDCMGKDAGVYTVTLTLTDPENYEFSGGGSEISFEFEIKPRPITVKLSDSHKYLFSSPTDPTFRVTDGEVVFGDELNLTFIFDGDKVSCESKNTNYALTVVDGRIIKHATFGEHDLFVLFVSFLVILTVVLIIFVLIKRRKDIRHYFSLIKYKLTPVSHSATENAQKPLLEAVAESGSIKVDTGIGVNAARADELISNSMAKSLVRRGREVVETDGNKKSIINVDTLNKSFTAGDLVDVNKLKNANLVPYDTAYIKVLARGMIDKPLKVYANDFSLCAVKMLALAGGEAIRVVTVAKKEGRKHARKQKNK